LTPFYKEDPKHFASHVVHVVNQVLDVDYSEIEDVEVATVNKARRMLTVLAASCPQTPNMPKLYAQPLRWNRDFRVEFHRGIVI